MSFIIITLATFITTIIAGLVVWYFQQDYLNKKERNKENQNKIITSINREKIITSNIFEDLKPGFNLQIANEILGNAIKVFSNDQSVKGESTNNSYLYLLKNATVKITSNDGLIIDSVTIFPLDKSIFFQHSFFKNNQLIFNKSKMPFELIGEYNHSVIIARHDESFVVEQIVGNPLYLKYTFFGCFETGWRRYNETQDGHLFVNGIINGLCISSTDKDAFYIYSYETR